MALKFINAGGSLTLSAVLLVAIWAIRSIRAAAKQQRASVRASNALNGCRSVPKYLCKLSAATVALLVKAQPIPYRVLDIRTTEAAAEEPLPAWLGIAVNIPETYLSAALTSPSIWARFASSSSSSSRSSSAEEAEQSSDRVAAAAAVNPPPSRDDLLVLVGNDDTQGLAATARAAAAGFDRVALIEGGSQGLLKQPAAAAAAGQACSDLPLLHRDSLALLLDLVPLPESAYAMCHSIISQRDPLQQQHQTHHHTAAAGDGLPATDPGDGSSVSQRLLVVDVRRHDERTLYGSIPGAVHIPVDELGSALQSSDAEQFRRRYHFDPPIPADVLVMQSRCNTRAQWAGQIAKDAGLPNVYVYQEGAHGWQFSSAVQAYAAYKQGDPPPEPESFIPSQPDLGAGVAELQQLGLLQLLLHQQSLH